MTWAWEIVFEVDFDSDPGDAASVWTDLSSRVAPRLTVEQSPAGSASTARLTLNNRDRALDPTNVAATYNLVPMRHARLRLVHNAITYDLFRGYVEDWPPVWPEFNQGQVDVRLTDALTWAALQDADVDLPAQTAGARIGALLDLAGWPADRRDLDTGLVTLEPFEQDGANLLRVMIDSADAEDGLLYVDPAGDVVFRDRHRDLDATPSLTLGPSGVKVASVDPRFGAGTVFNIGRVELADGDAYEIVDDASVAAYGPHTYIVRDVTLPPAEAEALAQWAVVRWAEPLLNLDRVQVHGHTDEGAPLPDLLAARLGDLAAFGHTPPGGGTVSMTGRLTNVTHRFDKGSVETSVDLASWHDGGPYLTLDDLVLGELDLNVLAP